MIQFDVVPTFMGSHKGGPKVDHTKNDTQSGYYAFVDPGKGESEEFQSRRGSNIF